MPAYYNFVECVLKLQIIHIRYWSCVSNSYSYSVFRIRRILTCSTHANPQTSPVNRQTNMRRQVTRQHIDVASSTLAMPLYMLSTCSSTPSTPVSPVGQFYGVAIYILLLHYVGPRTRKRLTRIPSGNYRLENDWLESLRETKFYTN